MSSDSAIHLLGLCLRDPKNFDTALARGVSVECFDHEEHSQVFFAMLEAEKAGKGLDATSLVMARPKLAETIIQLRAQAPITQSVEAFADELVVERWTREAMTVLRDGHTALLIRKAFEPVEPARLKLVETLSRLLTSATTQGEGPKKISDVLTTELKRLEEEQESGQAAGIPTGITAIDKITSGGLRRGSVNVFAARTGVGKTTLALNIANSVAMSGHAVCYFTVEMPAGQLARKLLSSVGRIRGTRIMTGALDADDCERLAGAAEKLHKAPIWIDDTFRASFESFEMACRRLKRQASLDMVVIDYVQQLSLAGRFQSKQQLVTEISHRIKQLALELDIAVLSLAQFNRDAEKQDGEPSLWQIKDSGAIEQDADLGVCLFRDEREQFWLKVDKNRWGRDRMKFPVDADLSINLFKNASINLEAF